jgi:DNA-binding IclR family transcriptional regulator
VFTPQTRKTVAEVLADIKEGRIVGYAKDTAEHEENVYCIAMPIFDYRKKIVAAVSITGFSDTVFSEEGLSIRNSLYDTSMEISKRLGYTPNN